MAKPVSGVRAAALWTAALCWLASACVTAPSGGAGLPGPPPPAASGPVDSPSGGSRALDLGDWPRGDPATTQDRFVRSLGDAVRPGEPMSAVLETMRANGFGCSPATRGEGPAQVCDRQFLQAGCTHTWQVLLFGDARLTEARGGYDRLCPDRERPGGGLLGAPPG